MPTSQPSFPIPMPDGGVRVDVLPENVPPDAFAAAENFLVRLGALRVRNGNTAYAGSVSARPTGYVWYPHNDGATRVVKATVSKWWKFSSSAWVDITGTALTGGPSDQQVFRVFDKAGVKYLLGTNGADSPKKWDGTSGTYANIAGTPPKARCMMIINDHVMLGNLKSSVGTAVAGGSSYDFSANIDFDSGWGATLSGILADTPGEIVSMLEMGSLRGAIYKTDAVHLAIASGGLYPVTIELKQAGIEGPVAPNAVARLSDGLHVFLAQDGSLQQFDGQTIEPLGGIVASRPIQRYIANSMDFSARERAFLVWDSFRKELLVVYPENGSTEPNRCALISFPSLALYPMRWDTLRMTAGAALRIASGPTIDELSGTIDQQTKTYGQFDTENRRLLLGDVGGQSYQDTGTTDNGAAINAFAEWGLADFGDQATFKTMCETDHIFDTAGGPQLVGVRVGGSDYGELRSMGAAQTVDVGAAGPYRIGHRQTNRQLSMRLEVAATQAVIWHGASAAIAIRGRR
jgi:hypothetical protein